MQAPQKYLDRFEKIENRTRRTYAAMLSAMDDGVGAVLEKLRQAGIEQETLIFFVSDNGGPIGVNGSRNDPFSGAKGGAMEGGIRVPLLVQWKGRVPAGKVYDRPVIALDITPTAVAAAGGKMSTDRVIDGVDLLPHITADLDKAPHEALFWRFGATQAIRKGDLKLVRSADQPWRLFDLAADVGEKKDLAAEKPEALKDLDAAWKAWDAQLAKPLWGGRRRNR